MVSLDSTCAHAAIINPVASMLSHDQLRFRHRCLIAVKMRSVCVREAKRYDERINWSSCVLRVASVLPSVATVLGCLFYPHAYRPQFLCARFGYLACVDSGRIHGSLLQLQSCGQLKYSVYKYKFRRPNAHHIAIPRMCIITHLQCDGLAGECLHKYLHSCDAIPEARALR